MALVSCSSAGANPEYSGRDLDCADIGHSGGWMAPIHGLDRDGDGIGCESY